MHNSSVLSSACFFAIAALVVWEVLGCVVSFFFLRHSLRSWFGCDTVTIAADEVSLSGQVAEMLRHEALDRLRLVVTPVERACTVLCVCVLVLCWAKGSGWYGIPVCALPLYSLLIVASRKQHLITMRNLKVGFCFLAAFHTVFILTHRADLFGFVPMTLFAHSAAVISGLAVSDIYLTIPVRTLVAMVRFAFLFSHSEFEIIVLEVFCCVFTCLLFVVDRRVNITKAGNRVKFEALDRERSAMLSLLGPQYDAIVWLDSEMRISRAAPDLARILSVSTGDSEGTELQGRLLADFAASVQEAASLQFIGKTAVAKDTTSIEQATAVQPGILHVTFCDVHSGMIQLRLVYASFPDASGRLFHVVGVSEVSERLPAAATSSENIEWPMDAQNMNGSEDTSLTSSKTQSTASAAQGESVTATFDALSPDLKVASFSDRWLAICGDPHTETYSLVQWISDRMVPEFRLFLCDHVNRALNGCQSTGTSILFKKVQSSAQDGVSYKARISVTFPDPEEAYDEESGSYMAVISMQHKKTVVDFRASEESLPPLYENGADRSVASGARQSWQQRSSRSSSGSSRRRSGSWRRRGGPMELCPAAPLVPVAPSPASLRRVGRADAAKLAL